MLRIMYSVFSVLAVLAISVVLKDVLNPLMQGGKLLIFLPAYGLVLFALAELLYRFTPMRRKLFYLEDYLKTGAWFAAYSFFVAGCILGAYAVTGVMLKGWLFVVFGYFAFRGINMVKARDAGEFL